VLPRSGLEPRAAAALLEPRGNPVNLRDVIAAIPAEALPVDDGRRIFTVLRTPYFALSC
jgi:hypothetical protein